MPSQINKITFALLGFGKLGQGFYNVWSKKKEKLFEETGFSFELKYILVKNKSYKRPANVDSKYFTTDINILLKDKSLNVVIDAIALRRIAVL